MAFLPHLPSVEGESLTSYMNRTAMFHCGQSLSKFLSVFEVSQGNLLLPGTETISRLSELTGFPSEALRKMTAMRSGNRRLVVDKESVHSQFFDLSKRPFCAECLLEDLSSSSASNGMAVGRLEWQMEPVRVCVRHQATLQARKIEKHADRFRLLPEFFDDRRVLQGFAEHAVAQKPSRLQEYVVARVGGQVGPAWLDDQPLDLAARACEMLGVVQVVGTHVDLRAVTEAEWVEAGDVGFEFASGGLEGINKGLQLIFDRHMATNLKGGPQKAFGRFYQWLQFNKNKRDAGPIREVAREFILDHFPIEAGANLMGAVVEKQRYHSVYSLARKTGDHPKTINRAVISVGLADGDSNKPNVEMLFDAGAAERLMEQVRTSISIVGLQKYLNCNRVQAQQLVRTGFLKRLFPESRVANGRLAGVSRESADEFLNSLLGAAERVAAASDGMMDIMSAAEKSRWPAMDIVRGVLSGMFSKVEMVEPNLKFKGILVDTNEVRDVLTRSQLKGYVGIEEAVELIGMPQQGVNNLVRLSDDDGMPYLSERAVLNAKGKKVRLFAMDEILLFRKKHISLLDIAVAQNLSPKVMKVKLDGRGLMPLAPKYELGRIWYRRADLDEI